MKLPIDQILHYQGTSMFSKNKQIRTTCKVDSEASPMRRLFLLVGQTAMFFIVGISAVIAEQKIDIKGFYPGLLLADIKKPVDFQCTTLPPNLDSGYTIICSERFGQKFKFKLTDALNPIVISRVTYRFSAQTDFDSLVDQIGKVYDSPTNGVRNIEDNEIVEVLRDMDFRNQFMVWNLVNKIYLAVTEDSTRALTQSGLTNVPSWLLSVWDRDLLEKNEHARMDKEKSQNPIPKF